MKQKKLKKKKNYNTEPAIERYNTKELFAKLILKNMLYGK